MIDVLMFHIRDRQSDIAEALAAGSAANWESYQRMVGEHIGLQTAINILNAMLDEEKDKE